MKKETFSSMDSKKNRGKKSLLAMVKNEAERFHSIWGLEENLYDDNPPRVGVVERAFKSIRGWIISLVAFCNTLPL